MPTTQTLEVLGRLMRIQFLTERLVRTPDGDVVVKLELGERIRQELLAARATLESLDADATV